LPAREGRRAVGACGDKMAALRLKLVHGVVSRTMWHIALLWLANRIFWSTYMLDIGLDSNPSFIVAAIVMFAACYPISAFLARDERLTNRVIRDLSIGLFYVFFLAPMLSVEMLPELPVDKATFSAIGTQIEKGMVTREDLDTVHKALWEASPRNETVPWKLASTTMFAPRIRISVPRSDIEHSSRHITRTKMGESVKEYDLLMLKFWVPLSTDAIGLDAEPTAAAGEDAETDGDPAPAATKPESDDFGKDEDPKGSETTAESADKKAAEPTAAKNTPEKPQKKRRQRRQKKVVEEDEEMEAHRADSASFVYLTARTSPRLNLWPHPKAKGKKKLARIMGQHVDVCGKLFNGVPGGEAVDDEAFKLNRNLREDPNSLAFSIRTDYCSSEPLFFSASGWAIYYILAPIYVLARVILSRYAQTIMQDRHDVSFIDELAEAFDTAIWAYHTVSKKLGKGKRS